MSHVMMPIDNFFRSAARWPDRIAVEINDGADQRKITYGDLAKSVNALANALQTIDPRRKAVLAFAPIIVSSIFLAGLQPMLLAKYGCR